MSLSVATIVVAHSADEYLSETLSQLSKQSHLIQQVVVVDTAESDQTAQIVSRYGFSIIQSKGLRLGAAISLAISSLRKDPDWLWILHDDSAPEPDALTHLARMAETSPSVAIVGPKLLRWDLPIEIQQMGLTLTQTGRPFLLVESEYDQGQFDVTTDTLAVSTAGMLVSLDVWNKIGGIDDSSPVLAQDIELCIKARAAGYRIVVEAQARVLHAGLSMNGRRDRGWLGGSYRQAISKAHIHLATIFAPALAVPFIYLLMPLFALASVPYHLVQKRPGRIFSQLIGWVWAWLSFPKRLLSRNRVKKFGQVAGMRSLFATSAQVRQKRDKSFEYPPEAKIERKGFFTSGTFYFSLLLPLVSLGQFPSGALISSAPPIGRSFESVWSHTSVTTASYLEGFELESNPFNWFLSLLALIGPSPSLSATWFVFLSGTLAFLSSWLLFGLFTSSALFRNIFALAYALSPAVLDLQVRVGLPELTAAVFAPLAAYLLIQSARAFNLARSWRWSALAGLAGGAVAVSSPAVFGILILLALLISVARLNRSVIILASALPGVVLLFPWAQATIPRFDLLLTTSAFRLAEPDFSIWPVVLLAISVFLAAVANARPAVVATAVLGSTLIALEALSGVALAETNALLGLGTLLMLLLAVSQLRASALRFLAGAVAAAVIAASGYFFGILPKRPSQSTDLTAPALVVAQADVDEQTRTLLISFEDGISADLVWGDGRSLDEVSVLYEALRPDSRLAEPVAKLTAQLAAGNLVDVEDLIREVGVDFVLVQGKSSDALATAAGVSAMPYFQLSGESSLGLLFRVNFETTASNPEVKTNRETGLLVLAAYLLLALPTPATVRGYRRKRS